MTTLLWRGALIILFFTLGVILSTVFGALFLLPLLLFLIITAWTLTLPFKKAVIIVVPVLVIFDILADGRIGAFFFFGFLLSVATAFFSVRIQKGKTISMATLFYLLLASFFACGNVVYQGGQMVSLEVILAHIVFSVVFFLPLLRCIGWLEGKLDTSFREAAQKIR
jgi:hypothetical protein